MSRHYTLKSSGPSATTFHLDYAGALNEAQFAAVTADPGPLLVIAGAGSGKTRTLTYRVAYLLESGVPADRILLLTFTNKAAKEMLERVTNLIPHDLSRLWGGTFHHIGHRILRRHAAEAGLADGFTILDREDARDIITASIPDAGIDPKDKRFPKAEVLGDIFSLAANTERSLAEIVTTQYPYFEDVIEGMNRVHTAYTARKRANNAVDYDDLLRLPLRLFQEHSEICEHYQEKFQHLLVDEYQDTNRIQSDFIDLLAARHHQVMVVGDDAQSIYSWRGANFANIMRFPDRHPGTQIIRIETNYRSVPSILHLANSSIANNANQFAKELRPIREGGSKPAIIPVGDARQQAMFVAQRALELREEGIELSDMAVLYRSHFHCMELQMELTRRNIPFQITSGLRFFEQAHIKDMAAYLKYAINERDELAFRRVALLLPGVGAQTAARLWQARLAGTAWNQIKVPDKAKAAWKQWEETHQQVIEQIGKQGPAAQLKLILDAIYENYLKTTYANAHNRLEDVRQLIDFASGFEDPAEFLAQLSLLTNLDAEGPTPSAPARNDEALRLSTIHQAKGLEWKVVFVIMLCDGLFPSSRSLESTEGEEEERRLFYVAVTRAQDELYLIYPKIRMTGGQGDIWQKPSRFLSEFSENLCQVWRVESDSAWET
ncbi:MAG: ATP-dependent helicase [Candidatus Methylacidiphilales bacterium]